MIRTETPKGIADDPEIFVHEQETWDEKECHKRSRSAPKDHWGNRPPRGIISWEGSAYAGYGRHMRYDGGGFGRDKYYRGGSYMPVPKIPDTYELYYKLSWGLCIRKKSEAPMTNTA